MKKICQNIKSLREYCGESLNELSKSINISKNAISNYEHGRVPHLEMLSLFANHYMISIEDLISQDFSNINQIELDLENILNQINVVLPIFSSEDALKNSQFALAFENHLLIFNQFKNFDFDNIFSLADCFEYYKEALKDKKSEDCAIINMLGIFCVFNFCIYVLKISKTMSSIYNKKDKDFIEFKKFINSEDYDQILKIFQDFVDSYKLEELIIKMKHNKTNSELAHYYLALKYFFDYCDNTKDNFFKIKVGFELMYSLASVKNRFALRFLNLNFHKKRTQIVDDMDF